MAVINKKILSIFFDVVVKRGWAGPFYFITSCLRTHRLSCERSKSGFTTGCTKPLAYYIIVYSLIFSKIMRKGALDYISHPDVGASAQKVLLLLLPYSHDMIKAGCFHDGIEWLTGQLPTGNFDSASRCASWPIRCPEINQAEAQTDCCSRCWAKAATHW